MKLGFAMQHRPFSFGEGIRGMRLRVERSTERRKGRCHEKLKLVTKSIITFSN